MGVIFPSCSHAVARRGTSFSGAGAEGACSHQEPQTSVKRHQDGDPRAIAEGVFQGQPLKTHDGRSEVAL